MFNETIDDEGRVRKDLIPYTNQVSLGSPTAPFKTIHVQSITSVNGDVTIPSGGSFQATAGAAQSLHTATLVAGTVTVANPNITATSKLFLSRKTAGGTIGELTYAVDPGVGYTITSASALDTSTVDILVVQGM